MDARTAVETLRARVEQVLRPLVAPAARVALIDFPNYPNVGDSAIYLGQLACLAALGAPKPCFVCDFRTYDRAELARRIGTRGTILLTGGGSFGDLWPFAQELREDIARSFPNNPIVQLPQTIHFQRADTLHRARATLNAHAHFTLLVRDFRSQEIARNEFAVPSHLCPDMAFALGPLARTRTAERPLLWLMRTDKERLIELSDAHQPREDWLDEPPMALRELSYLLMGATRRASLSRVARPLLSGIYAPLARRRLRRGLEILSSAEVVITDRLHGHILSLLLGIPHVMLDNNYGKLSSFYTTWIRDVDDVRLAGSPAEALALAAEQLRALRQGRGEGGINSGEAPIPAAVSASRRV